MFAEEGQRAEIRFWKDFFIIEQFDDLYDEVRETVICVSGMADEMFLGLKEMNSSVVRA